MVSGFWLTQNIIAIYVPTGLLINTLHLSGFKLTSTLLLSYVVLCFSYIGAGMFRQKIGRRRFFVTVGQLIAAIGAALLYALGNAHDLSLPAIMLMVCALSVLVTSPLGVLITYINQRQRALRAPSPRDEFRCRLQSARDPAVVL